MSASRTATRPLRALQRCTHNSCGLSRSQSASFSTSTPASQEAARPAPSTSSTPPHVQSPLKRLRHEMGDLPPENAPQVQIQEALLNLAKERGVPIPNELKQFDTDAVRLPRAVQALHLTPLRRKPTHGIPVCNLQIRSYSARNLEFMADFALRAAYYLNLPAKGPVPLPRITERWTVPRSLFVHKKSQENWERITMRRLVQIQDGHPEVVQRWLAFIRKWSWHGVGMRADVFEHEGMDVVKNMDADEQAVQVGIESVDWNLVGRRKGLSSAQEMEKFVEGKGFAPGAAAASPSTAATQESPKQAAKPARKAKEPQPEAA